MQEKDFHNNVVVIPGGELWLQRVRSLPMLSESEEQGLALQWRNHRD